MLERSWKWSPCLEFWILYQRFGGQVDVFFGHLLAEIFGAISLCSFWKGRLKENHLSAVTGRGVDRRYTIVYGNLEKPWKHRNWLLHNWRHCLKKRTNRFHSFSVYPLILMDGRTPNHCNLAISFLLLAFFPIPMGMPRNRVPPFHPWTNNHCLY